MRLSLYETITSGFVATGNKIPYSINFFVRRFTLQRKRLYKINR